ncbi:MAG: beta-lactamase family protein [Acidobacteria bacterium]|nr:beta-lactamase family protein [Acidobacteriota bacterium]
MLTTVGDLLKWNENFVHAKVGGKAMVAAQQKPAVLTNGKAISYAAGLMLWESGGIKEVAHSGATGGYRTWLGRYPEFGVSVAVMCNSGKANAVMLGRQTAMLWTGGKEDLDEPGKELKGMFRNLSDNTVERKGFFEDAGGGRLKQETPNGDLLFERVEPWKASAKDVAAFIGEYESDKTGSLVVIQAGQKEGELSLKVEVAKMMLRPTFRDAFETGPYSFVFRRNGAGKVIEMSAGDSRVWDLRFQRRAGK